MIDTAIMAAILDSLKAPILFADTDHIVRYMNAAAVAHYSGGVALLGRSVLECHNSQSQQVIHDVLAAMREGTEERMITDDAERRIYMRAVRGRDGELLGYYERYAPPARQLAEP